MFGRKQFLERTDQLEHIKIAKYLIDHDLFIDIQSKWGYNQFAGLGICQIFIETWCSSIEAMKLLCDHGADPSITDEYSGLTPIRMARTHIEASTILNNAKRKLELKTSTLEHADSSYCIVCAISSKLKTCIV